MIHIHDNPRCRKLAVWQWNSTHSNFHTVTKYYQLTNTSKLLLLLFINFSQQEGKNNKLQLFIHIQAQVHNSHMDYGCWIENRRMGRHEAEKRRDLTSVGPKGILVCSGGSKVHVGPLVSWSWRLAGRLVPLVEQGPFVPFHKGLLSRFLNRD